MRKIVIALIVVPVLYAVFARIKESMAKRFQVETNV